MNICISKLLYDEEKVLDEDDGVYPAGVCEGGEEQGVAVVLYITIGNTKIFMLCLAWNCFLQESFLCHFHLDLILVCSGIISFKF